MIKREIAQLAIYQIDKAAETVSFAAIQDLYINKTSEIIYITKNKKLYGIVCVGEALRSKESGEVQINRMYTKLLGFNIMKAHEIFQSNRKIHKIPVINELGELLGDYSRWDDLLYIKRNFRELMQETSLKKVFAMYESIYVIKPVESKNKYFLQLTACLERFQIKYTTLDKERVGEKIYENSVCVFFDEDERRGVWCLYRIQPRIRDDAGYDIARYDLLMDTRLKLRLATWRSLLLQIEENALMERLGMAERIPLYDRIDEKATILLSALQQKGVKCFCLYNDEVKLTEYGRNFRKKVRERLEVYPVSLEKPWIKEKENKEFYSELYQLDDYKKEVAQREIFDSRCEFDYKSSITGKYFNVREGRRVTCYQPEDYVGTIYFLGPCIVIGALVEDQYTIESYLQKQLLKKGYLYRVENLGILIRPDSKIEDRLQEIEEFHGNDIVIYMSRIGQANKIQGKSLEKIFEEQNIPSEWVVDMYMHCNHKANHLIADNMLDMIEPFLSRKTREIGGGIQIDFKFVMKNYIHNKYLNRYFARLDMGEYSTIGSIVMNCNPFSKGHRYLIEQACGQVELLIVFVVEENESLFTFEERFMLVREGCKDLKNIMIVPSGEFILSRNNFCEYFSKEEDQVIICNAEYDIDVFAEYIAKPLHITHRFAGEEPEDRVTQIYNETMRRILPQKGIVFAEIPRKTCGNQFISASRVRNYLENEMYDEAFTLLPETTKQFLIEQI